MLRPVVSSAYRIGVDENGLGARLGPLVVTGVLARSTEQGSVFLSRKLPKRIAEDLNDSKKILSHGNVSLGEAWARALVGAAADTPAALFERLSLEGSAALKEICPSDVGRQCWSVHDERFTADDEQVKRVTGHVERLRQKGVEVLAVRTSVLCAKALNDARTSGKNRFIADLHAMERLVLDLRDRAGEDIHAVCGKVGGMHDYSRFFGPLSLRLHSILRRGKPRSEYHFPGIGQVHFVRDADARDPLVMLASVVGKYVRELLMARVSSFYRGLDESLPTVSGYHDPVTARFVELTSLVRRQEKIPAGCFERLGCEEA